MGNKGYANRILEEYAPKSETNAEKLKKLNQKIKRPANIFAYIFGFISVLILGTGMSIVMVGFGPSVTIELIVGSILGVIGLALCSMNYIIHSEWLSYRKDIYASEVMKLTKEIAAE